jgi:hypothetical protein
MGLLALSLGFLELDDARTQGLGIVGIFARLIVLGI